MTNQIQTVKTVSSQDVVCIALDIHLWSARIQLRAEDLQKYSQSLTDLPDSAFASLGSVKLCDPEVIRRFERLKREAQGVLETNGLPLFGIRAVPANKFDDVRLKLEGIKERFNQEATQLLNTYVQIVGDWRKAWELKNPGYGLLLDRIPKAESVFGRLSFEYHAYRVEPPKGEDTDESSAEFTTKLTGLRGELYQDAEREAITLLEESFVKNGSQREYITPKTLGPFKRIAQRFRDFAFLDPSANAAADLIESTVSQALQFAQSDKKGRISDGPMMLVYAMANTFANPQTAVALAEKARAEGTQSAWDYLMGMGEVTAAVVTETQTKPKVEIQVDDQFDSNMIEQDMNSENESSTEFTQFESSLLAMKQSNQVDEIGNQSLFQVQAKPTEASNVIDVDAIDVTHQSQAKVVTGIDLLSLF